MSAPVQGFIETMARRLRAMEDHKALLDQVTLRLGLEPVGPIESGTVPEATRLAQRDARSAMLAVEVHCIALEDLILRSRAETMADAVAQVMVASVRLEVMASIPTEDERDREAGVLRVALKGALRAMASATGIGLTELSGLHNASVWSDPWPDVDVCGETATRPGEISVAMDDRASIGQVAV